MPDNIVPTGAKIKREPLRDRPGGETYTSESGPGRVKRYATDGTFVPMVGILQLSPGCKRVTVAVNKDGSRVYVLDTHRNLVHVLAGPPTKAKPPATAPAAPAAR